MTKKLFPCTHPLRSASILLVAFALCVGFGSKASAQILSVLHQFQPGPGGINPEGGVILDSQGNLYGTTLNDGAGSAGTVYEFTTTGEEKILHKFTGLNGDGAFPNYVTLAVDSRGNLYGTTFGGGTYDQFCLFGCGTAFKIAPNSKETVVYSFTGQNGDASMPWSGMIRDSAGNLYGTTAFGGANGVGSVYRISPSGKERVLHSFTGRSDGQSPYGTLAIDDQGNLFGTTLNNVFEISAAGKFTVLYTFGAPPDANFPESGLIIDSAGNLYGTTAVGGTLGLGTVFKITPSGQESILYSFIGGSDGDTPEYANLVMDSAGNLYGVTPFGGFSNDGVVFKLDPSGNETVLHSFSGIDGRLPYGTLAMDGSGNLYGTTYQGGSFNGGVIFEITP